MRSDPRLPDSARPIARFDRPGETLPGYCVRADGVVLYWDGARGRPQWVPLKVKIGPGGFRKVRLRIDGKEREIGVAQLVLRAFVGPRPLGHEPLHYPDTDPGNNRLENLRWALRGTSKVGRILGPAPPPIVHGEGRSNAVLTERDIPVVRSHYRAGWRYKEIAADMGVADETVRHVLIGETWSHIPDPLGPIVMRKGPDSEDSARALLDWRGARAIRAGHAAGLSYRQLSDRHGVSKCCVRDVIKGRTWKE